MSPEARVFFKLAAGSIGKNMTDIEGNPIDPAPRFAQLLEQTRMIDAQSRMRMGNMQAAELAEGDIAAAASNPQVAAQLLAAVRSSPAETALLQQRIEKAKGVTNVQPSGAQ